MPAHSATDIGPVTNDFVTMTAPSTKEFVISGFSGRFPESDNTAEFREHLINGDDMVTEDDRRWAPGENATLKACIILKFRFKIKLCQIFVQLFLQPSSFYWLNMNHHNAKCRLKVNSI